MIIDIHTHAWRGQGTAQEFIAEMDRYGIDVSAVLAMPPLPAFGDASNEYVYEFIQQYPDRLIGFASVMPLERKAPDELEYWISQRGFRGLKLHPAIQDFMPSDPRTFPVIRKAIELDVPILYHTGPIYLQWARQIYADPNLLDDVALAFPEAKIIAAHCDPLGWIPALACKHPNVFTDTSFQFAERCSLIRGLGELTLTRTTSASSTLADKTLFGSDANPGFGIKRFEQNIEPIRALKVSGETVSKVLGGNAARLLRLDRKN